jgi:hypothetical protein
MEPRPFFADPADAFLSLSVADSEDFARLQTFFSQHRPSSFIQELMSLIAFVERRPEDRELRAHVTGVFRIPPFLCINTRVLKNLIHRCKSSINNSLQELGYSMVKAKTTGDSSVLPELTAFLQLSPSSRQWTVRLCNQIHQPEQPIPVIETPEDPEPFDYKVTTMDEGTSFLSDDMDDGGLFSMFR